MSTICVIGHITKDRIVTKDSERFMPGGTAYYFSKAVNQLGGEIELITAVGPAEQDTVYALENDGIKTLALDSQSSAYFENIYPDNQDQREQNVLTKAVAFTSTNVPEINANCIHLGPLMNDDISLELIQSLSQHSELSLDIQGFLRKTVHKKVVYGDWADKSEGLKHIHTLKANEDEAHILSGKEDHKEAAQVLADFGVKEVIITLGSRGSLIYSANQFYHIPAYKPREVVDATGCGDTYMAGYLFKRQSGASLEDSGKFGAAMATIKIQSFGPFNGTLEQAEELMT